MPPHNPQPAGIPQPAPARTAAGTGPGRAQVWLWTAWVAALWAVLIAGRMVLGHADNRAEVILEPPALIAAREQLQIDPTNEALKEQIRATDLELRRRYFRHLSHNAIGAWLLLAAGLLCVISARTAMAARRRLPQPGPQDLDALDPKRATTHARRAVGAIGLTLAAALGAVSLLSTSPLPNSIAGLETLMATASIGLPDRPAGPDPAEWFANWPMFRGPRGDGVSPTTNAPLEWDAESGKGILWKSPVPVPGFSSPVVWGNRLLLSGGSAASRHLLCYDTQQGNLLWNQEIPPPPGGYPEPPDLPEFTGFAAPTPATDGQRVYAMFGTGDLAAFDFEGRRLWTKHYGVPDNMYGHATSLTLWNDLLLVQLDQGDGKDGRSRLYALEGATGKVRWEQRRQVPSTWTSPVVFELAGRSQLITLAEPWVIAYAPATGAELWRVDCLGTDLAPMPVHGSQLLIVTSPHNTLTAIRPDGDGDITDSHIAWVYSDYVPDITSPISTGDLVFVVTTHGDVVCVDGTSGKTLWEQSLDLEFNASPVLSGQHLYLVSADGVTTVIEATRTFREVARSTLEDKFHASPAIVGGRLFLRGHAHLYALGAADASDPSQP
jgi:outer membrane protein assembly factor BamB